MKIEDWMSEELLAASQVAAWTTLAYVILALVRRRLDPPWGKLAFASSESHANRTLEAWTDRKQTWRAFLVIAIELMAVIPLYVITALFLAIAVDDPSRPVITIVNAVAAFAVILAALVHYAHNACIVFTLIAGARTLVVFLTPIFGWIKNSLLALVVVYAFFRAEIHLYAQVKAQELQYTLPWLVAATLFVAILMARRQTALSKSHPPLVALQLAPSRLAAMDVLERWGEKGRTKAHRALRMQFLFAMLYGVTLAEICERVQVENPYIQKGATILGWLMLIAAACHLAQNLGAWAALHFRFMGWWVAVMRRLGWVRMGLLGLAGAYSVVLLVELEWQWAEFFAGTIKTWMGRNSGPAA